MLLLRSHSRRLSLAHYRLVRGVVVWLARWLARLAAVSRASHRFATRSFCSSHRGGAAAVARAVGLRSILASLSGAPLSRANVVVAAYWTLVEPWLTYGARGGGDGCCGGCFSGAWCWAPRCWYRSDSFDNLPLKWSSLDGTRRGDGLALIGAQISLLSRPPLSLSPASITHHTPSVCVCVCVSLHRQPLG